MKKSGMSAKSFVCIMALAISFGFLSGCDEDSGGGSSDSSGTATGPTTVINPSASGTYTVDFNDLTIIINLTSFVSDTYVCDGPSGQMDLIILGIDETLLRLYDPEDDDETWWTRDPGTPGDIVGDWEMIVEDDEVWTLIFDSDDNVSIEFSGFMSCETIK